MKKDLQEFFLRLIGFWSRLMPKTAAKVACRIYLTPPVFRAPDKEGLFLSSANESVRRHGCALWRWGEGPRKILLIHGWAGRGAQMRAFVEPLVLMDFEVWVMDGPGHGQSDKEPTNMARFSERIGLIGDEMGGWFAVIGHSLGGAAALVAAGLGAQIENLVLIGAPSRIERVTEFFSRRLGLSLRGQRALFEEVQKQVARPLEEMSPLIVAPKLKAHGLILHDPEDPQVAFSHAKDLDAVWSNSRLEAVEAVGHDRILRSPVAVGLVQQFLIARKT